MSDQDVIQTLVESFSALAAEVQTLIDRKTVLEHKLIFAHSQYQHLADKYAPAAPEVADALAKLQLPPNLQHPALASTSFVPLPKRGQSDTSQHQIALLIREGRRAAHQLSAATDVSKSGSSKETSARTTLTTMSTVLEQDFTVEGKKGDLDCPFSPMKQEEPGRLADQPDGADGALDHTPHHSTDPICAAMFEESTSQHAPSNAGAAQCPIRFLDKHSPEEIANYVEKHKHEIPRSHEVCVRRYQKNEEQIKKLDAKYGNLVSMIKDLSQLHQPMLPSADAEGQGQADDVDKASNERVENWAQGVTASAADDAEHAETGDEADGDHDRESHFDRALNEVRLGESPTRPWGITVPVFDEASSLRSHEDERPASPAAPVRMPSPEPGETPKVAAESARKCPFDHTKFAHFRAEASPPPRKVEGKSSVGAAVDEPMEPPFTPLKKQQAPSSRDEPAFINPDDLQTDERNGPQMLFTGPVFIGYPIEQAIQFMQHFQKR